MITETSQNVVVTFADGLPGFESCRQFVLVESEEFQPFRVVQGLDENGPSFVGIDPRRGAVDSDCDTDSDPEGSGNPRRAH